MGDGTVMEEGTRAHHRASQQEQGWKLTQAARTLVSDPDTRMARYIVMDPWHRAPRPPVGQRVREACSCSLTPQHPQATATAVPLPDQAVRPASPGRLLGSRRWLAGRGGKGDRLDLEIGDSATSGRHRGLCTLLSAGPHLTRRTWEFLRSLKGVS